MGMFDYIRCKMPFPIQEPGLTELQFQTKSFDNCAMDNFEIREDGSIWREEYDLRIEETKNSMFGFFLHRDNPRWVPYPHSGEVRFWEFRKAVVAERIEGVEGDAAERSLHPAYDEVEFLAFAMTGQVRELHLITATGKWKELLNG